MTQDVLVSVKGFHQTEIPEADEIEVFSAGKYYLKNGKHYIMFEEAIPDSTEVIKSRITLKDGVMEVQKKGPITSNMTFERGTKTSSWYHTPFGNMHAGITVREMNITEQEDLLEIYVDYELELDYAHASDTKIRVKVLSKGSEKFKLVE